MYVFNKQRRNKQKNNNSRRSGGVAANSRLREMLEAECKKANMSFFAPESILCTDNAAMIGCAGYYRLMRGYTSDLTLNAEASMSLFG